MSYFEIFLFFLDRQEFPKYTEKGGAR